MEAQQNILNTIYEYKLITQVFISVASFILISMVTIIVFFIKRFVSGQDRNSKSIIRLENENITLKTSVVALEKLNESKLQNLTDNVNKLTKSLEEHTKIIDERIHQKDKTNELLIDLLKTISNK